MNESTARVDVSIDRNPFTSYVFADTTGMLKKPILHPIVAASGTPVTRGFPLRSQPGERADHPHQVGSWMNHGDVNDLDFWNNSGARLAEDAWRHGTIVHREILEMASGEKGILRVSADWIGPDSSIVLDEMTRFEFWEDDGLRFIDRTTTWTARDDTVKFEDSKEGMMAVRVARQLEHPTDREDPFVLPDGSLSKPRVDSSYATGRYLNSEGIEGEEVWGRRAEWVVLNGTIDGQPVALGLMDHPANVGYPTHWMARGYGLFAANPLGTRIYSEGAESLDFTLEPHRSVTFQYRLLVKSGSTLSADRMRTEHTEFISNSSGISESTHETE